MSGEQLDPLDALAAAADRGEAAPAAAAPGDALAPAADDEGPQWIGAAEHFGSLARSMLPAHAAEHWTPERLHAVGVELAGCAKHYGWKFGAVLNHPLARLAAVSFPLAWPLIEPFARPYLAGLSLKGAATAAAPADAQPEQLAPSAARPVKVKPIEG